MGNVPEASCLSVEVGCGTRVVESMKPAPVWLGAGAPSTGAACRSAAAFLLPLQVWDKDLLTQDDVMGRASWVFVPQQVRARLCGWSAAPSGRASNACGHSAGHHACCLVRLASPACLTPSPPPAVYCRRVCAVGAAGAAEVAGGQGAAAAAAAPPQEAGEVQGSDPAGGPIPALHVPGHPAPAGARALHAVLLSQRRCVAGAVPYPPGACTCLLLAMQSWVRSPPDHHTRLANTSRRRLCSRRTQASS